MRPGELILPTAAALLFLLSGLSLTSGCNKALCASDVSKCLIQVRHIRGFHALNALSLWEPWVLNVGFARVSPAVEETEPRLSDLWQKMPFQTLKLGYSLWSSVCWCQTTIRPHRNVASIFRESHKAAVKMHTNLRSLPTNKRHLGDATLWWQTGTVFVCVPHFTELFCGKCLCERSQVQAFHPTVLQLFCVNEHCCFSWQEHKSDVVWGGSRVRVEEVKP